MDHRESFRGNDLDAFYISILRQTGIHKNVRPLIGRLGRNHDVFRQIDDEIRLADLPRFLILELARWRRVGGISLRRSAVHPLDDDRDFLIG